MTKDRFTPGLPGLPGLFAFCLTAALTCARGAEEVETHAGPLSAAGLASMNVAAQANGGVASASSCYGGSCSTSAFPPAGVNDGDRKGLNWGHGGGWNDDTVGAFPDSVQIAFASRKTINEVDVFTLQDNYTSPSDPTSTMTFTQYGITSFEQPGFLQSNEVRHETING